MNELTPREERIMYLLADIIWYGSIVGLFVLLSIAISQKKFKDR